MVQVTAKNSELTRRRRLIQRLFVAVLLAVILWRVFIFAGGVLRQIAFTQIIELINARVQAQTVDFNINGSVVIEKLVISPFKKQGDDDDILKAETVYARFGIGSLLLLRPRIREISIKDFVFNSQYNMDSGQWNVASLRIKTPKGGSGKLPLIHLESGVLQYSNVSKGRVKVVKTIPIYAGFKPAQEPSGGYSFDMTIAKEGKSSKSRLIGFWQPGKIAIAGNIPLDSFSLFDRVWEIKLADAELNYDPNSNYSFKLIVNDLVGEKNPVGTTAGPSPRRASDALALDKLPFLQSWGVIDALQNFFDQYRATGRIDIELNAEGSFKQLNKSSLTGQINCKDVSVCVRRFPYLIEHLKGRIDFTGNSVLLDNLTGLHDKVTLVINGWAKDFGPERKYEIRMTSNNMALDDDLYNALGHKQQGFWSLFSPTGQAAIDYRISRQSPTEKQSTLVVDLQGTGATYRYFPYPLKNLVGSLFFDSNGITFSNIVSRADEHTITVDGKVTTPPDERPICDILIKVDNIPLDSTLQAALAEGQRRLYEQFCPSGFADGVISVFTDKDDANGSGTTFVADLSFRQGALRSSGIPLSISNISAKAVFTPDSIQVNDFVGEHASGLIFITGQIWPGQKEGGLKYFLKINGKQAQLNDELLGLLPQELEKFVAEFEPAGKVNYIAELDKTELNEYPDYKIAVDCLADSVNYRAFPYPLKDVTGTVKITKDIITLQNLTATAADSFLIAPNTPIVKLDGELTIVNNAFAGGKFELSAENIPFDEHLGVALPQSHKDLYWRLSPTGRFDVNCATIKATVAGNNQKDIDFDGLIRFKGCGLSVPISISELDGRLKMQLLYKTGAGLQNGYAIFCADSIGILGKTFSNLKADIDYNQNQKGWYAENLTADCYGGRLIGRFDFGELNRTEFSQASGRAPDYLLQVGFENIDLKQFLSDKSGDAVVTAGQLKSNPPAADYTGGKMSGALSIAGQGDNNIRQIGRCRLVISDMKVGRLSPMAKLLYILKLTEPRDFAFDRLVIDSYIKHDKLFIEKFDLSGKAIAFNGSGWMDLDSYNLNLTLTARGERLTAADPSILQSLAEGISGAIVRMEVTGSIYDPQVTTKALPLIEDSLRILGTKPTKSD